MITKRALEQWRRDSLNPQFNIDSAENPNPYTTISVDRLLELHNRILRLTAELLDQHLMKR